MTSIPYISNAQCLGCLQVSRSLMSEASVDLTSITPLCIFNGINKHIGLV